MQLTKETIEFMSRAMRVAKLLKIEDLILDHECVRGNVVSEGSMIIHRDNLPKFQFQKMGIGRIKTLSDRLALLGDDVQVDTVEKEKSPEDTLVFKLLLKKGRTQVEFRCADPAMIEAPPKRLKDPAFFNFKMDEETVKLLTKALGAVKGEVMAFEGNKEDGVVAHLSDVEGDMLAHIVTKTLIYTPECDKEKFHFSYKNKILIPLLREAIVDEQIDINITRRGFLNLQVLGINIYITTEL